MSKPLIIGWALVSTLVALYLGKRIGMTYVRGRISTEWVWALTLVLGLFAAWILVVALRIPIEYTLWVFTLIGAIGYGATA